MDPSTINNTTMFIEAIAMPVAAGLVVGLIAGKLLRSLAVLAVVALVLVVGLALAGITHIDSSTVEGAKSSVPLVKQTAAMAWQTARSSPPCIMGALVGVALRMLIRSRA